MIADILRLRRIASDIRNPKSVRQAAVQALRPLESAEGLRPAKVT